MTDIPDGNEDKPISNRHVVRLAEDQMQRLMRCIVASNWLNRTGQKESFLIDWRVAEEMLKEEPKPEPAPGLGGLWEECQKYKQENEQLKDKLNRMEIQWSGCETLNAELNEIITEQAKENEQLKAQIEARTQDNLKADIIHDLKQENKQLKAQIPKKRLKVTIQEPRYINDCGYRVQVWNRPLALIETLTNRDGAQQFAEDHGFEVVSNE